MTKNEAIHLFNTHHYEQAIPFFLNYILSNSEELSHDTKVEACYYLALCYKNQGNSEDCLYYLTLSFQYSSPIPEICCELGFYYYEKKQYEKAISWFHFAIQQSQNKHTHFYIEDYWGFIPHIQLCLCYYQLGNFLAANEHNEAAGMFKPDSEYYLHNKQLFDQIVKLTSISTLEKEKQSIQKERITYSSFPHPGVSLILVTKKANFIDNIFLNYHRLQYPEKELILILNNNELSKEDYLKYTGDSDSIKVYQLAEEVTLGECLNYGIQQASYDFIAKIDDDDYYGANYLLDQMALFHTTEADVVVKSTRFIFFENDQTLQIYIGHGENQFVLGGGGGTILAKRNVFDRVPFQKLNLAEDAAFFYDCEKQHFKVYAGNKFNYIYKRYINTNNHTFIVSDQSFQNYSSKVDCTGDFEAVASV